MEFNQKLQQLRKQRGWTQEQLAQELYVSRTAISKWESGRGYPSIDSLKAISKLFSVSIDNLFSGEELISLAETEQKQKVKSMRDFMFGILDCMMALMFVLPLFAQRQEDGYIQSVPLLYFNQTKDYILIAYAILISITVLFGVTQLILQNWKQRIWVQSKTGISLALSVFAMLLAISNREPNPGLFLLCILIVKGTLLVKKQ